MNRIFPFIPTALLATLALTAGQHPQPQQTVPRPAQQVQPAAKMSSPPQAYTFHAIVPPDTTKSGVSLGDHMSFDTVALSDSGEAAAVVHWQEDTGEHSAVFTSGRVVASDREAIDGKTIARITGPSLAINRSGVVAYEATYADTFSPSGGKTGVFVESHFIADLAITGGGNDFTLLDDGRVTGRDGSILNQPTSFASTPTSQIPAKIPSSNCDGFNAHLSNKAKNWLIKHSPFQTDSGDPLKDLTKACNDPQTAPASTSPQAQPFRPQPVPVSPLPAPPPVRPLAPCPLPAFPMPAEWQMGGDGSGPITSHAFDGVSATRLYDSPIYGKLKSPIRSVQYAPDCRAILVTIGDSAVRGRFEIWSASGLVTYQGPDGSWVFPGFAGKVTSSDFARTNTAIQINRRGRLLIPVKLAHGCALLLGDLAENTQ